MTTPRRRRDQETKAEQHAGKRPQPHRVVEHRDAGTARQRAKHAAGAHERRPRVERVEDDGQRRTVARCDCIWRRRRDRDVRWDAAAADARCRHRRRTARGEECRKERGLRAVPQTATFKHTWHV
eukprot:130536-Chlamydomonas_euryale.AAC.5